jgi:EpsI family protein
MTARLLIVASVLSLVAVGIAWTSRPEQPPARVQLRELPTNIGQWTGHDQDDFDEKTLAVLGVDDYITRTYLAPAANPVSLYVGYYESQRTGDTMHSPMRCLPGTGWQPLTTSVEQIAVEGQPHPIAVNRYLVQKGLQRHIVMFWYQMHGRVIANEYATKLFLIRDAVQLNRTDGAMVRLIVPIANEDESAADHTAAAFVRAMFPLLGAHLPA